jgi:hypothetical protein
MIRESWAYLFLSAALLLLSAAAVRAQELPPVPPPDLLQAGAPDGGPGPFVERVEVLGLLGLEEMQGGRAVTGAPFSAMAVSQSTQTLADGNHISRKTQVNLYRDAQGRFRREVTLAGIGPLQASGQPKSFVMIHDPVAGTGYVLEPDQKLARKMPGLPGMKGLGAGVGPHGAFGYKEFKGANEGSVKTESLGTQTLNGVSADGTRYTRTIAAGEIGNEKPITIVSERWYSSDLQLVVKSTRTDPRFGTTTYTLTNLQRAEPAASLFTVPADYTVQEGGPGPGGRARRAFHGEPPAAPPSN